LFRLLRIDVTIFYCHQTFGWEKVYSRIAQHLKKGGENEKGSSFFGPDDGFVVFSGTGGWCPSGKKG
jgi:hypothetical protein